MGSETTDPYAHIAHWYDLEHDGVVDDLECYTSLIGAPATQHASVLEIGSGTGRVAAALALAGYRVTGVEPSEAMRARCLHRLSGLPERVSRRVRVVTGSATDPHLEESARFDIVLIGLNTFAHLTTARERQNALARMYTVTHVEGLLILDLDLAGPRRLLESAGKLWWQGTWPVPETSEEVSHFVAAMPGREPGTVNVAHFYDVSAPGGVVHRTSTQMPMALLSYGEVELALRYAGFTLEAAYGSYDLTPYDDLASRAIVVARRTAQG